MKKSFFTIITLTLLMLLLSTLFPSSLIQAKTFDPPPMDDPAKPWTITFNEPIESGKGNLQMIYVRSADNKNIEISYKISADLEKVTVIPINYYTFGETYTLVVPKGFKSAHGKETTEDTTLTFQIEGKVITEISATSNPLLTNIIVKGMEEISKVDILSNRLPGEVTLNSVGTHFSKGFLGLQKGDSLTIQAYDINNTLLETQYYNVK